MLSIYETKHNLYKKSLIFVSNIRINTIRETNDWRECLIGHGSGGHRQRVRQLGPQCLQMRQTVIIFDIGDAEEAVVDNGGHKYELRTLFGHFQHLCHSGLIREEHCYGPFAAQV